MVDSTSEFDVDLTGQRITFPGIENGDKPLYLASKIGGGAYGDVYRAHLVDFPKGKQFAVKYYKEETKTIMAEGIGCTTVRELSAVQSCGHHPNIVKMEDLYLGPCRSIVLYINEKAAEWVHDKGEDIEGHPLPLDQIFVFAAYEYCEGGDLSRVLSQQRQQRPGENHLWGLPLLEAKRLSFQMLNGLAYLHNHKMCHRDLKPDNLMLERSGTGGILRIGDLGLCRELRSNVGEITPTVCTIYYRPLEVLLGKMRFPESSEAAENAGDYFGCGPQYGLAVDIWSAGCIIAEMILGSALFKGTQEFELLMRVTKVLGTPSEEEWFNCTRLQHYPFHDEQNSPRFYCENKIQHLNSVLYGKMDVQGLDLLSRMLNYNPHHRITAAEALSHEWFSDVNFGYLDGLGVYNWCCEVIKYKVGAETYVAMEAHDKGCLETTELSHAICQKHMGPLAERINKCFEEVEGHRTCRKVENTLKTSDVSVKDSNLAFYEVQSNQPLRQNKRRPLRGVNLSQSLWNDARRIAENMHQPVFTANNSAKSNQFNQNNETKNQVTQESEDELDTYFLERGKKAVAKKGSTSENALLQFPSPSVSAPARQQLLDVCKQVVGIEKKNDGRKRLDVKDAKLIKKSSRVQSISTQRDSISSSQLNQS